MFFMPYVNDAIPLLNLEHVFKFFLLLHVVKFKFTFIYLLFIFFNTLGVFYVKVVMLISHF